MLKETYLSNVKTAKIENPDAIFVYVNHGILKPEFSLLNDFLYWKERFDKENSEVKASEKAWITSHYDYRYRKQVMYNPDAVKEIKRIAELSLVKDVFLICYEKEPPCHRYLLMEIIKRQIEAVR